MTAAIAPPSLGSLEGRVTIVTGAAVGIGRAAAEMFAQAGARLAVVDRDEETLAAAAEAVGAGGAEVLPLACDIGDAAQVEAMVARTVEHYGRLDCAFNNAGTDSIHWLTAEVPDEEWRRVIDVNLNGTFYCVKHEINAMLQTGGGSIVNGSSGLGIVAVPKRPAYTASKHGILGITRAATLEYARQGIRVNAVCPGIIDTPMVDRAFVANPEEKGLLDTAQPIGRLDRPDEVAAVALFLLSDAASFVLGAAIEVDGGYLAG